MDRETAFAGRRAVVTGGASGMGAATAALLAEQGADVTVLDVREPADGRPRYVAVDLRDESAIEQALAQLEGQIDVLVNSAGLPQTFPFEDVFACNFAGTRHLTERVVDRMPEGGAIVNVSSIVGRSWRLHTDVLGELLATSTMAEAAAWVADHTDIGDPYIFSKMAVHLYTHTRAVQLAADGIRMNAVAPGNTSTAMSAHFEQAAGKKVLDTMSSVAGRAATPDQQAEAICFLASDRASYINGVVLDVDGGFNAAVDTGQLGFRTSVEAGSLRETQGA